MKVFRNCLFSITSFTMIVKMTRDCQNDAFWTVLEDLNKYCVGAYIQTNSRVFVFPDRRPFACTRVLAPAPNLYLPVLAPNLYLQALAPKLYLPVLAPNLYLPALASICIYQPWPPICVYRT